MCIFHKWARAEMTEGMKKRKVFGRRVCLKCGRVEIAKQDLLFKLHWLYNRDVDPTKIRVIVPAPTEEDHAEMNPEENYPAPKCPCPKCNVMIPPTVPGGKCPECGAQLC